MLRKFMMVMGLMLAIVFTVYSQKRSSFPKVDKPFSLNEVAAKGDIISIKFGTSGRIELNTRTGTADMFNSINKVISSAYAAAKNGQTTYTTSMYTTRKYTKVSFSDAIGSGTKYVVQFEAKRLPAMKQTFYTYANKDYFFVEVSLSGTSLSSNYMAPLISDNVNLFAEGVNRILFVPFDNDTFISYNAKSMSSPATNTSAEVGAFYENGSRKGLIVGSVEHMTWKTGVKTTGGGSKLSALEVWGGYSEAAVTRDTIPHGSISGSTIKSPKMFVGYFNDWRNGLEQYGKANRLLEKPYVFNWTKPTPFGWNSWGVMQEHITYEKAIAVADFFADSLPLFKSDNTAYIDLDSYWDKFVKGGINGDISKLKQFAEYCNSKGLQPGVYWAPFTDWGWNYTGSASRKVEGGSIYTYGDIWTKTGGHYHNIDGARALDPTHPGTQQRIALFISKFKECGFKMIKIDFLGHGAIEADSFYGKAVTTGMQAYRKGMEYLVDQLGDQMLIYAAISPNLATGRYVHTRRIACDAFKSILDTRYTLNSVNYGWWQTYVYKYIDADHIVFNNESEGANRARLASGLITGTLIMGDDYSMHGPWSERAKELLQNKEVLALAQNGVAFKPVYGNSGDTTNALFQQVIDGYLYIAVFNFTDKAEGYHIKLDRVGITPSKKYEATEIFSGKKINIEGLINVTLNGSDAAIYKIKL
jgi:alpha-galactosidase